MEAISDAAHRVAALGPRTVVMLIVATVFLILTWISFALRVYVRAIMIRSFGKDDWTMLLTLCLFTTCCGLLISIERLEQSDRPRRVLEEGPLAQLDLLNHIMKVCCMPSFLFMLANETAVHSVIDGYIHPDHYHPENQSGNLFPQDRCAEMAKKSHICCNGGLHHLRHSFRLHRCLPMWCSNTLSDQGSRWRVHT